MEKRLNLFTVFALFLVQTVLFVSVVKLVNYVSTPPAELDYMIAALVSSLPIIIYAKVENIASQFLRTREKLKLSGWIGYIACGVSLGLLAGMFTGLVNKALAPLGVSFIAEAGAAEPKSFALFSVLYVCLVGPIIEEICWRGVMMKSLLRFGPKTAIVVSALFFGLMHHYLAQSFSAFIGGMLLGYVAYRYSLKASIALHIITNTWAYVVDVINVPNTAGSMVVGVVTIVLLIIAIVSLVRFRKGAKQRKLAREKAREGLEEAPVVETATESPNRPSEIPGAAGADREPLQKLAMVLSFWLLLLVDTSYMFYESIHFIG